MRCARRGSSACGAAWASLRPTLFAVIVLLALLRDARARSDSVLATWNELEIAITELQAETSAPSLEQLAPIRVLLDRLEHDAPAIQTWTTVHAETYAVATTDVAGAELEYGIETGARLRALHRGRAVAAVAGVDPTRSLTYVRCASILSIYVGEIAASSGHFDQAIEALGRSVTDSNAAGEPSCIPRARSGLAEALRIQGRFDEAEAQLEALLLLLDELVAMETEPFHPGRARWYRDAHAMQSAGRVMLYADMGMPDQAARWLARHRRELVPSVAQTEPAEVDLAAVVALAGERCQNVVEMIDDDVLARALPSQRGSLLARRGVALTELALRDPGLVDRARADLEEALSLAPSFSMRRLAEITFLELAAICRDWTDVGHRLAALRGRTDDPAFNVDERALLAALAARLARETGATDSARAAALAELRAAYCAQLAAWSSARLRPGGVGFLNYSGRRSVLGELVGELIATAKPNELGDVELEPVFRGEAVGTLARSLDAPIATLAEIRAEVLRDDVGWIAFVPAARTTHVFAVDRDEVVHCEIDWRYLSEPLRKELGAKVARVFPRTDRTAVETHRAEVDRAAAQWAKQLLPEPIQSALRRWSGCYVTGLELLGNPPIEVLPLDGRPLGIARGVARLPSMSVALALARRPRRSRAADLPELRLFAAPKLDANTREQAGDPPRIALDDAQVRALTEPFGAGAVETFVGADASLSALRTSARRPPRILHILAHAVERLEREDFATLVLTGDDGEAGLASPADVHQWLASDVLILSACATAQGRTRIGDDGAGQFVGAGLRAGAHCVLAADQRIELEATVEFGRLVHRALAAGACPAEAVRRAREQMDSSAAFGLPACWALIAVHGLGFEN
ncbi:MAG: CHAT domain-containing protein [Planctomycetes bacterium]|nr:CHAT domain-containing protein [Planctomycetota bacterium]MCC7169217.1 CHAT domain-containing protein [Planctomycetota bacterium]